MNAYTITVLVIFALYGGGWWAWDVYKWVQTRKEQRNVNKLKEKLDDVSVRVRVIEEVYKMRRKD